MYAALAGSTGAALTSAFHQLSGGRIGSGSAPPTVAVPCAAALPAPASARTKANDAAPLPEIPIHVHDDVRGPAGAVEHVQRGRAVRRDAGERVVGAHLP